VLEVTQEDKPKGTETAKLPGQRSWHYRSAPPPVKGFLRRLLPPGIDFGRAYFPWAWRCLARGKHRHPV